MTKFWSFIFLVMGATILAGLYGAIHDQFMFAISNEYFIKFKYNQFGFDPDWFGGDRQTVAIIGFLSSWWMGFYIGIILSLTGLLHKDARAMRKFTTRAIFVVLLTVICFGPYGYFYSMARTEQGDFDTVASIHNFGYLGGVVGLILAVCYQIYQWRINRKLTTG
jgi:hypothetical protein